MKFAKTVIVLTLGFVVSVAIAAEGYRTSGAASGTVNVAVKVFCDDGYTATNAKHIVTANGVSRSLNYITEQCPTDVTEYCSGVEFSCYRGNMDPYGCSGELWCEPN